MHGHRVNIAWMSADALVLVPSFCPQNLAWGPGPKAETCAQCAPARCLEQTHTYLIRASLQPYDLLGGHCDGSHCTDERVEAQPSSSYHIQGGRRQQRVSAHGNSQPAATCNSEASRCTPGLTAGAGHPQLTSSRQVRMRTLPYRQRLAPTTRKGWPQETSDILSPLTGLF